MKSFLPAILGIGLPLTVAVALQGACSSGSSVPPVDAGTDTAAHHDSAPPVDTGPPPCDDKKCFAGNKCLPDDKGKVACQLPCAAQYGQTPPADAGAGSCPFNYTCTDFPAGTPAGSSDRAYCTPNKTTLKNGPGVWGATCNPTGGIMSNPDCDSSQGFWCNAKSPTDANAYCTIFQCTSDTDCPGGWWCATENVGPNAASNNRTIKKTITVCEPRNYCATCRTDLDCDSTDQVPEHCIADHSGGSYCAPECNKDSNCNNEAQCILLDQSNYCKPGSTCVCAARARLCVGDGMLCAPCRSDDDCKAGGGLCLNAYDSTEHFCSVPSGPKQPSCAVATESDGGQYLIADCPTSDEAPNMYMGQQLISCLTQPDGYNPANQCIGLVVLGITSAQPIPVTGCWTPNR